MRTKDKTDTFESRHPEPKMRFTSWLARLMLIVAMGVIPTLAPQRAVPTFAQTTPGAVAGMFIAGDVTDNIDVFLPGDYPVTPFANGPFQPPAGALDSFDGSFTILDGLTVGDFINGDNVDEVAVAGDATHVVEIFDIVGRPLTSFDSSYNVGDGFFAADVDGNGTDELVVIGNAFGAVDIYDATGALLNSFDTDVLLFDGFTTGDVLNGDGVDEILTVGHFSGFVKIYDRFGTLLGSCDTTFDDGDGFVAGNIDGSTPQDEIVVVGGTAGFVEIHNADSPASDITDSPCPLVNSYDTAFGPSDGLAMGDVVGGDGVDEMVQTGDVSDNAEVYDLAGNLLRFFNSDFSISDVLAIGRNPYPDKDRDGLLDSWETSGDIDNDGTMDINLRAMGADPLRQDLFLELDWMPGTGVGQLDITAMEAAFDAAPANTGGFTLPGVKPGINLWVDTGNLSDPLLGEDGTVPVCLDGLDNGGDGLVDFADDDCVASLGAFEDGVVSTCVDSQDNGGDGLIDGNDPDCAVGYNLNGITNNPSASEDGAGPNSCSDLLDNGGDGLVDFQDPDCTVGARGGSAVPLNPFCGMDGIFYDTKAANFNPIRELVFRYALSGPASTGCEKGGSGEIGGNDFAEHNFDGGTIMHELGHNLGLEHGGDVGFNCKPNYVSVMDYDEQLGIQVSSSSAVVPGAFMVNGAVQILDYSPPRFPGGRGMAPLADLVEDDLDEATILDSTDNSNMFVFANDQDPNRKVQWPLNGDADGDGPGDGNGNGMGDGVDWNGDNDVVDSDLSVNIDDSAPTGSPPVNRPDACGNFFANARMLGHDDWSVISVRFRQFGDSDDSAINPVTEPESTLEDLLALQEALNTTDLSLAISDTPDPVAAGADLVYTLDVTNHGPNPGNGVHVVDTLPAGVTFVSASGATCSEAPLGTLTCDLERFANYESRQLQITVRVAADLVYQAGGPLSISNSATVSHDAGQDTDLANNSASTSTQVIAVADLDIVSFDAGNAPPELLIGQPVTVALHKVITNHGPSAPMDVTVTRTASGAADTTVTPTSASTVEPAVGLDEQRVVNEEFTLKCNAPGHHLFTFTNTIAPAHPEDSDPDLSNNQATLTFDVDCIVPVAINIHPHQIPNSINPGSEVPVAVLTTAAGEYGLPLAFDATTIDALTARFGPRNLTWSNNGGATEIHGQGHLERSYELDEKTRDRDLDMILHFSAAQSGLGLSDTEACVKGRWHDAANHNFGFFGCDTVNMVPVAVAQTDAEANPDNPIPSVETKMFLPQLSH
jgi:uncharacterized repeat protein (TIGR01451 family)